MLQRYFTPHSAAMAEYALANAVIDRLKHQKSNPDDPHLSPIASLSSKEGLLQQHCLQCSWHAQMTGICLPEQVSCFGTFTCSTTAIRLRLRYLQSEDCALKGASLARCPHCQPSCGIPCTGRMTPAANAGEEAQIIIEEVANLLRTSAGSAEQMRRLDSARSSLMSDLEATQSLGSERAASAEGLDPAFLARLGQAPSAPMPLKGGETSLISALASLYQF